MDKMIFMTDKVWWFWSKIESRDMIESDDFNDRWGVIIGWRMEFDEFDP